MPRSDEISSIKSVYPTTDCIGLKKSKNPTLNENLKYQTWFPFEYVLLNLQVQKFHILIISVLVKSNSEKDNHM